ncbi:hypothetical protein [Spirosoma fluminis]
MLPAQSIQAIQPNEAMRAAKQQSNFQYFRIIITRWRDNDTYGHVNNMLILDEDNTGFNRLANGEAIQQVIRCSFKRCNSQTDRVR